MIVSLSPKLVLYRYSRYTSDFNRAPSLLVAITAIIFIFASATAHSEDKVILALGDSLTAGLGLARSLGFAAQLETKLVHSGVRAIVIDGGVSGDTSAGGLARLDWLLVERPDLVIVELGANDGLRGLKPLATLSNLRKIVRQVTTRGSRVLLAGMRAPPNMGVEYTREFNSIYETVAREHNTMLFPFFLEGVAAIPHLNQADGMHPNAEGVKIIVENILPMVIALLKIEDQ